MKKINKLLVILFTLVGLSVAVFFVYQLVQKANKNEVTPVQINKSQKPTVKPSQAPIEETIPGEKKYDYSITVGTTRIGIGDDLSKFDLRSLLGEPISEKSEVTGPEAFPYAGISVQTTEYEGITIISCQAKDGVYYINDINVSSAKFPTVLGIKVGDDLERLTEVYPVEQVENPEDPSQVIYYYFEGDSGGWAMQYDITNDKVSRFHLSEVWD